MGKKQQRKTVRAKGLALALTVFSLALSYID
jgi:hypothetical protein